MLNANKERMVSLGHRIRQMIPIHNFRDITKDLQDVGIDVHTFTDKRYQSALEWDAVNDRPMIALNCEQDRMERNFAMLHELSHLLLEYRWSPTNDTHMDDQYILNVEYSQQGCNAFQDHKSPSRLNEFAMAYLIPNQEIQEAINQGELDYLELVGTLSRKFLVPFNMAQMRLDTFMATD